MQKNLVWITLFVFVFAAAYSQENPAVSLGRKGKTDTVWISATMKNNSKPGSLMVVCCSNETNICDTLFYPLVNVQNNFELSVPESYQNGSIDLKCYYYPDVFQIAGILNNDSEKKDVEVFMLTANDSSYNKVIGIDSISHSFYLPKFVFENSASVFFNYTNGKKSKKPDITIRQFPAPSDFTNLVYSGNISFSDVVMNVKQYDSLKNAGVNLGNVTLTEGRGKELNEVVVKGGRNAKFLSFRKEFVSGRFSNTNAREFDCISNDEILNFYTCFDFLRNKLAGFRMQKDGNGKDVINWQWGNIGTFFIDEIEVYFEQIRYLDVTTIGLIQLFPANLVTPGPYSLNGGGNILSVYTRKGKYARPGSYTNNWIFSVKGYTPDEYQLFSSN
ncbi:MAG: hypothetical protein ACOVP7_10760 [Lacibacter sp.]